MMPAANMLLSGTFQSRCAGSTVEYQAIVPLHAIAEPLPLIIHLHGAMSSSASLEAAKPAYDLAWANDELPQAVVVCATTPTQGGFYMDYPSGPLWESVVGPVGPKLRFWPSRRTFWERGIRY